MNRSKPKIDTRAPSPGLHNPFAAIESSGLPPGAEPEAPSPPAPEEATPAGKRERLVLRRETAHRGGRTVVVVGGFEGPSREVLETLAHDLKRACGTGGTVKGEEIEIQGEKSLEVAALLRRRGYRVVGEVG